MNIHTAVYQIVSQLVVCQEVHHAATVLTSEIIARAPTMRMNKHIVVYRIVSQLVVCQEVLHAATVLISEIIARAPTMGVHEHIVVFRIVSLLVAYREILHAATRRLKSETIARALAMERMIGTVVWKTKSQLVAGKASTESTVIPHTSHRPTQLSPSYLARKRITWHSSNLCNSLKHGTACNNNFFHNDVERKIERRVTWYRGRFFAQH